MSTTLEWGKSGLRIRIETNKRPIPRTTRAYPLPTLGVAQASLIALALEPHPTNGQMGIRVTSQSAEGLPGGDSLDLTWTLMHTAYVGAAPAVLTWESIDLGAVWQLNYLFSPALLNATHRFYLVSQTTRRPGGGGGKGAGGGEVVTYPEASIVTPTQDDFTQSILDAQADATAALTQIANLSSDGILSVSEKPAAISEYTGLASQVTMLRSQATAVGATLPTPNTLLAYLTSLGPYAWNDTAAGHDTLIPTPSVWTSKWNEIYSEVSALNSNIAAKLNTGVAGAAATATWGSIGGALASQADLMAALNAKASLSGAAFTGGVSLTASVAELTLKGGGSSLGVIFGQYADKSVNLTVTDAAALNFATANMNRLTISATGAFDFHNGAMSGIGSMTMSDLLVQGQAAAWSVVAAVSGGLAAGYFAKLESDYGAQTLRLTSRLGKILTADAYGATTSIWSNNVEALRFASNQAATFMAGLSAPGATFTNDVAINHPSDHSRMFISAIAGKSSVVYNIVGGVLRGAWACNGSMSTIESWDATGTWLDTPLSVSNVLNGNIAFSANRTVTMGALQVLTQAFVNPSGDGTFGGFGFGQSVNNNSPAYGLAGRLTVNAGFGTHGGVTGDYAIYSRIQAGSNRGWIWQYGGGTNVASLTTAGLLTLNTGLTVNAPSGTTQLRLNAGTEKWQVGTNAGATGADNTFGIYSETWGPAHSYYPLFHLSQAGNGSGYIGNSLILTIGNVGDNAATLQAAVASATAPKVGTYAQMVAFTPAPGTTPYWYATDVTAPDGMLGRLYQWNGSGWVDQGNPQTVVGRIVAGVISAGAVGAQAFASDISFSNIFRTINYSAGTSTVPPVGAKFAGTAWSATLIGGETLSVNAELGENVSLGGWKVLTVKDRVGYVNRIRNGRLYRGLMDWFGEGASWSASGSTGYAYVQGVTAAYDITASISQAFSAPKRLPGQTINLTLQTGIASNNAGGDACDVAVYLMDLGSGTETLLANYAYATTNAAMAWTNRTIDVTGYFNAISDYAIRIQLHATNTSGFARTTTVAVRDITLNL